MHFMQVIVLATVALAVASVASVAVPKLSGDLIDICISFGQGTYTSDSAKQKLNGDLWLSYHSLLSFAYLPYSVKLASI